MDETFIVAWGKFWIAMELLDPQSLTGYCLDEEALLEAQVFHFFDTVFCLYLPIFKASIRCYNVSVRVHFSSWWYILLFSRTRCKFSKALKNKRLKVLTWWWCWGCWSIDFRRLNLNNITWLDVWYKELHDFTCSTLIWC